MVYKMVALEFYKLWHSRGGVRAGVSSSISQGYTGGVRAGV